jgi:hypothetical protein
MAILSQGTNDISSLDHHRDNSIAQPLSLHKPFFNAIIQGCWSPSNWYLSAKSHSSTTTWSILTAHSSKHKYPTLVTILLSSSWGLERPSPDSLSCSTWTRPKNHSCVTEDQYWHTEVHFRPWTLKEASWHWPLGEDLIVQHNGHNHC